MHKLLGVIDFSINSLNSLVSVSKNETKIIEKQQNQNKANTPALKYLNQ